MKNLYSILFLLATAITSVAQPTLTTSNFVPSIGAMQLYYVADTNTILDNTTGANVVFDYSGMRGYGATQTQYVIDPTTTTFSSDFLSATYADTTGGSAINKNYKKVELTDSLTNIGLVADIPTYGTVVAKYDQDPETIMKFPFVFSDNYSDSYSGTFSVQGVTTNGNGTDTVNADGWGELILPIGAPIDSVLRVRTIEHLITDTIVIPFPPITILPVSIDAEYVNYYKPSLSKFPLLSFINGTYTQDNNTLASTTVVISQFPMYGVGVNELNEDNVSLTLFPNPAEQGSSTLSFNLEQSLNTKITVLNSVGKLVQTVYNGNLPKGKNKLTVKTSTLSQGLYFVNINVDNKNITKKLIIK